MTIRPAIAGDAPAIAALIRSLARFFTLDPSGNGAEAYFAGNTPAAIAAYIADPRFAYDVGECDGRLIGVVAVRDRSHLLHLFVAEEFHGRGWAGVLWRAARDKAVAVAGTRRFTVNATPVALAVYEHFGFKATAPRVEANGVSFVPMALDLDPRPDG